MKQLKTIFLIIGTIIGAGFVSGKEISSFFTIFGYYSYIFIPPVFILLYFSIKKLLVIGAKNNINNIDALNLIIFKKNNKIIKIFSFISFIILSSTMISAFNTAFNFQAFTISHFISLLLITLLCVIIICFDISKIKNLSLFVVPIIILLMLIICFFNFNSSTNILLSNIVLLPYNALTYVCRNVFLSYYVIAKSSKNYTEKQCKQISFFSSLILCTIMILVINAELGNLNILTSSMPLLTLAQNSSTLYILYFLALQLAILTTLISTLITLKSYFHFKLKFLNSLVPTIICAIFSLMSFDYFVVYLYPIIGIFGFYLLFYLSPFNFLFKKSNQNIHTTSKDT